MVSKPRLEKMKEIVQTSRNATAVAKAKRVLEIDAALKSARVRRREQVSKAFGNLPQIEFKPLGG